MSKLIPVEFHGDVLWAQEVDGVVYVAMKPVCEALSLAWNGQWERIQRDQVLSGSIRMTRMVTFGKEREVLCLPLHLLNGWLFGIDDNRIKDPEVRERIIAYKRECYDVLYRHFHRKPEAMPEAPSVSPDLPPTDTRQWIDAIALALRVHGRGAARRMWEQSPLPQVGAADPTERAPSDRPDLDGAGCMAFLLDWEPFADGVPLSQWIVNPPSADLRTKLAARGVILRPKRFKRSFGVANRNEALTNLFRGTQWEDAWTDALMQVPGVAKYPVAGWFGKTASRFLVVPFDIVPGFPT